MKCNRSRVTRYVLAFLALSLVGAEENCRPGELPVQPLRTYVLFLDLSLSLTDTQAQGLEAALAQIIPHMPPGSHVVVYPIAEKVIAAGPLYETTLPSADDVIERKRAREVLEKVQPAIREAITSMRATLGDGTSLRHTCISDALRQGAKEAREFHSSARRGVDELEIIFISDMLEDCNASLLGPPLSLEKPDISEEIGLARTLPADLLVDLKRGRVTMLLPPLALAEPRTRRPHEHELETFWRAILDRCNDDPAMFAFGSSLPERLKRPTPQKLQ